MSADLTKVGHWRLSIKSPSALDFQISDKRGFKNKIVFPHLNPN